MSESQEVTVIPAGTRVYCKITDSEANRINVYLLDNEAFEEMDPELFLLHAGAVLSAVVDGSEACGSDVRVRLKLDEENVKFDLFNGSLVKFVKDPCEFSPGTACGDDTYLEWLAYDSLAREAKADVEKEDEEVIEIPKELETPTAQPAAPAIPASAMFVFGSFEDPLDQLPGMVQGLAFSLDKEGDMLKASPLDCADDIRGHTSDMIIWFGDIPDDHDKETLLASVLPNYMVERFKGFVITRIKVNPSS